MTLPDVSFVMPSDNYTTFTIMGNVTKSQFVDAIDDFANKTFDLHPIKTLQTFRDLVWVEETLENLTDAFWGNITNPEEQAGLLNAEEVRKFLEALVTFANLIWNSFFEAFQIHTLDDHQFTDRDPFSFEEAVGQSNSSRFELVVSGRYLARGRVPSCEADQVL